MCPRRGEKCNDFTCGNMFDGYCGGKPMTIGDLFRKFSDRELAEALCDLDIRWDGSIQIDFDKFSDKDERDQAIEKIMNWLNREVVKLD